MPANRAARTKGKIMRKEPNSHEGRKYLMGSEAAALMGVNPRTVYRMIQGGELVATHARKNRLRIALDDVKAWRARQGLPDSPPFDHVEQLIQEIEALKALVQEILPLRVLIPRLLQQLDRVQVVPTTSLIGQNEDSAEIAERTRSALGLDELVQLFAGLRFSRSSHESTSVLERRGLPTGTLTVAAFARQHEVKVSRIKKLFEDNQIALTIIQRSNAMRNTREWWITPEQQRVLFLYWQQQMPYVPCPQCPHDSSGAAHAE